jgi:4-amino-4-deoxychorismate lyase
VTYAEQIQSIEYLPYVEKSIQTLKIVSSNIDYGYKYANRDTLNALLPSDADDILIEKEGLLTDTSIANIAFYDGKQWFTPSTPLLKGTMRAKLLDEGFLHTRDIKVQDIRHYAQVALINAMIGFKILKDIQIMDNKGNTYDY